MPVDDEMDSDREDNEELEVDAAGGVGRAG